MISEALLVLALLAAAQPRTEAAEPGWLEARPGYAWSFPRDYYRHEGYKTEWWYLTGQLTPRDETRPRFGYQLTFFRIGLARHPASSQSAWDTRDLLMGHAALTDLETGRHRFSEVIYRASPLLAGFGSGAGEPIAWSVAPPGTDAAWVLGLQAETFRFSARDDSEHFGFTLEARSSKPQVLQGPQGLSRKSERGGAASLYASLTRLVTSGSVQLEGQIWQVSGTSWLDQEIGSDQLAPEQVGWDWFGLQLDDGRELMLYQLRDADGHVDFAHGTLVARDGTVRYLAGDAIPLSVEGSWKSRHTDAVYPAAWKLRVADLEMFIEPLVREAENRSRLLPRLFYWEGPVVARALDGGRMGHGYAELTGYGNADVAWRLRTSEPAR